MENETKNIWTGCVGKPGEKCPCINFTWKKPTRNVIYTEENLTEEFSSDYNAKSLVTILNPIQYTKNGIESCMAFPTGPRCIPINNCSQRPDGSIICTRGGPDLDAYKNLPKLGIFYRLEYYEFSYKKCKLSPRRCVCKPHYKDHYCMSYSTFSHSPYGKTFTQFAEDVVKDKNNGRFQLGVYINLTYPKGSTPYYGCQIKSKYNGIIMEDDPLNILAPWGTIRHSNCNFITREGSQPPRTNCGELNFHLPRFHFRKGKPPAGTPPLIGPVKVPY